MPRLRLHERYCVIKKNHNRQKGDVISDQVRIHNNVGGYAATATVGSPTTTTTEAGQRKPGPGQGGGHTVALSAFGPNINTVKVREFKQQEPINMQWQMASPFSILYSEENAPRSGLPS